MSDDTIQNAEVVEQQPSAPSLQISDLVLALQTLQAVTQRGAIRADEMSTVGPLYDRLFAFLEAQGAITRQQPQQAAQTGEDNA